MRINSDRAFKGKLLLERFVRKFNAFKPSTCSIVQMHTHEIPIPYMLPSMLYHPEEDFCPKHKSIEPTQRRQLSENEFGSIPLNRKIRNKEKKFPIKFHCPYTCILSASLSLLCHCCIAVLSSCFVRRKFANCTNLRIDPAETKEENAPAGQYCPPRP